MKMLSKIVQTTLANNIDVDPLETYIACLQHVSTRVLKLSD